MKRGLNFGIFLFKKSTTTTTVVIAIMRLLDWGFARTAGFILLLLLLLSRVESDATCENLLLVVVG